jgi:diphthine synthase
MLRLVGLGLWDERDLSIRAIDTAKQSAAVYIEKYTSELMGSTKERLEKALGTKVIELSRDDVEGKAAFIDEAKAKDITLLVGGDPLAATTHADIVLRARAKGVEVRVVHNASVFSAIAETGLQLYKFGRTATVVFWEDNYKPTSFYDAVKENDARGLHTLLLLDIQPDRKMTPNEAIETLTRIDPKFADRDIVIASRLGAPDSKIVYGKAKALAKKDFGKPMHVLVVPGKLHEAEKEYLEAFK